jgi:hypothetical protein
MILPGMFPAQVRSRPTVRGGIVYNNARVNNTTIQFKKSDFPASPGDMVVFLYYAEFFSEAFPSIITSDFGFTPMPYTSGPFDRGLNGYSVWTGSEPDTMSIICPNARIAIASYCIYVVTGITKLTSNIYANNTGSMPILTTPARIWFNAVGNDGGSTQVATPPNGYTGYLQATTTAADNGGVRSAYTIIDASTQPGGSWTNLPTPTGSMSVGFR